MLFLIISLADMIYIMWLTSGCTISDFSEAFKTMSKHFSQDTVDFTSFMGICIIAFVSNIIYFVCWATNCKAIGILTTNVSTINEVMHKLCLKLDTRVDHQNSQSKFSKMQNARLVFILGEFFSVAYVAMYIWFCTYISQHFPHTQEIFCATDIQVIISITLGSISSYYWVYSPLAASADVVVCVFLDNLIDGYTKWNLLITSLRCSHNASFNDSITISSKHNNKVVVPGCRLVYSVAEIKLRISFTKESIIYVMYWNKK